LNALLACVPDLAVIQALQARRSLAAFVEQTTGYIVEPWQRIICSRLQELVGQQGRRLLIHGPPQHGKSILISQRFPAWALGKRPADRVRVACYNVSHAERFTRVVLSLMRDPTFTTIFPDPGTRVPAICSADEWSTAAREARADANPSMKALGMGTGFTGLGVETLILDDPYKSAQEARSAAVNTMLWDWWTQVVLSRLNPATNIVVMFHRWWEGDFAGRLLEQGGWELLRFPAIADGGSDDPTGRAVGEPLSPRYPLDHLATIRAQQGTAFEALYQGTPYPAEGGLFKTGAVSFLDAVPAAIAARCRRWDIAASAGKNDYTAGVLLAGLPGGRWLVEDVVRGQWGPDERDRQIRLTAELDRARGSVTQVVPQDPGAAGVDMAASLVRLLAGHRVEAVRETGDKTTRADPLASQWNAGNVSVLRAEWNRAFLEEIEHFPQGRHDDMVDAVSGAFAKLASAHGLQIFF
jgi:predicted phage terminase large subunit-like protein